MPFDVDALLSTEQGPLQADAQRRLRIVDESDAVARLTSILEALQATLAVTGTVALDEAALSALESITATLSGAVALDAATLAALETVQVGNFPATQPISGTVAVTGVATEATLDRAADRLDQVLDVADDYGSVEHLADQDGAGAILTFTAASPGDLVWVDVDPADPADSDNYRCRATVDGTNPSETSGWVCRPGPNPIPVPMTGAAVKVWAPAQVTVAVQVIHRG
jgi:hypothetical protein